MIRVTLSFRLRLFPMKNMICKTSLLRHKSPCLPLEIFKLLKKREERSNNVGKTVVISSHIFCETLVHCLFGRNNKSLKLLRYKILIYLIAGMLDSFLNISRDF